MTMYQLATHKINWGTCPSAQVFAVGLVPLQINLISSYQYHSDFYTNFKIKLAFK